MEEIKKVPGLPFWASSNGTIYNKRGRPYSLQEIAGGYLGFTTRLGGKCKRYLAHRLVAMAFIDNPNGYPCVNHKDESRNNNRADNLEWCTYKYNANYGTKIERQAEHQLNRPDKSRAVVGTKGNEAVYYPSAMQVQRELGINNSSVNACCRGKRKTAGGYCWRYAS